MQTRKKLIAQVIGASFAGVLLAGCGGSSSDTSSATLSGVAAEGKAIANTTITLKDANGVTRTATTDANGNFSFSSTGLTAPMMLKIAGTGGTFYTLITGEDTGKRINVTNFTHSIALMALSAADATALEEKFANGSFKSVSASTVTAADTAFATMLQNELGNVPGVTNISPRFAVFVPATATSAGDEFDRVLNLFKPLPGDGNGFVAFNVPPEFLKNPTSTSYDGNTDDLLTAGLGRTGLAAAAPAFADPLNPTAAELRRNAIHGNYRAIVDTSAASGYGTMYGPNVDKDNVATGGEGKVAGKEYIAYVDDGTGRKNVTVMVQIPSTFDTGNPCIVTGTSSGSRGIYGAIGSAGEWGLKNGCAVAYTDKGTGTGLHTFDDDKVNLRDGTRTTATAAGTSSIFTSLMNAAARSTFANLFPNRISFKHAHSQQNPERDWGQNTLDAVAYAFYALNQEYGQTVPGQTLKLRTIKPSNTLVLASSISNGAGAALLAAERDKLGLIDGVAGNEPQIQPKTSAGYTVQQNGSAVGAQGKSLYDYSTFAALYQPCIAGNANRCSSLVAKGLLSGADLAAQQTDARSKLSGYGWTDDSQSFQTALAGIFGGALAGFNGNTNVLVAVTYANAYGRFSPDDKVCGFSFANTDGSGNPIALADTVRAQSFANQNGIIGNVVYEDSVGGAKLFTSGVSPSTSVADQSLDGILCLRALATGTDPVTGAALTGTLATQSERVRAGIAEVQATGDLRKKPTVIVAGRSDHLVPVNHASRAYLGLNAAVEGNASKLRYIEVTNANHFDVFTGFVPGTIVPMHIYLFRALDAVYANLKTGASLPPSQVVRTTTRASAAETITNAHLPTIAATPATGDAITVSGTTVNVPN